MENWFKNMIIALISSMVVCTVDLITTNFLSAEGEVLIFLGLWILFNQFDLLKHGKKTSKNNIKG